jgi:hypothetical protein
VRYPWHHHASLLILSINDIAPLRRRGRRGRPRGGGQGGGARGAHAMQARSASGQAAQEDDLEFNFRFYLFFH